MEPDKGSIAFCQAGFLGLIIMVQEDNSVNNVPTKVYRGIHLDADKLGSPWQSISPQVVGNIADLTQKFRE